MKGFLVLPLAFVVGCGGGAGVGSSAAVPFMGVYGHGTATQSAYRADGTLTTTVFTDQPTTAAVQSGGRFQIIVMYSHTVSDVAHNEIDKLTGDVSPTGAITGTKRTVTIDGIASPANALGGGTGVASTALGTTSFEVSFPDRSGASDAGTVRYSVRLQP